MNGHEFAQYLLNASKELEQYINEDTPEIMGNLAVAHFKEGFQTGTEGFTDETLEKWDNVKRRLYPKDKKAGAFRAILTGETGDLGASISYKRESAQATVYSDKPYAEAHNEGTTNAGRKHNVTIPKRQFIGDSKVLNDKILHEITSDISRIINESPQ